MKGQSLSDKLLNYLKHPELRKTRHIESLIWVMPLHRLNPYMAHASFAVSDMDNGFRSPKTSAERTKTSSLVLLHGKV